MESVVLPDTSLCAIIRDEKMNPAGGIERFIDAHVPYVEEAVIADTGSVDGTREILEEMKKKYSNLKVVDIPFNGYADARNKSLTHVKTKRALILDADELLTHEKPQNDWEIIKKFIEEHPSKTYQFFFDVISPVRIDRNTSWGHGLRLFDASAFENPFRKAIWECFNLPSTELRPVHISKVSIKHFVPSDKAANLKSKNWYNTEFSVYDVPIVQLEETISNWQKIPPSRREGFFLWKKYNPIRDRYI